MPTTNYHSIPKKSPYISALEKLSALRNSHVKTGGGPKSNISLTPWEEFLAPYLKAKKTFTGGWNKSCSVTRPVIVHTALSSINIVNTVKCCPQGLLKHVQYWQHSESCNGLHKIIIIYLTGVLSGMETPVGACAVEPAVVPEVTEEPQIIPFVRSGR